MSQWAREYRYNLLISHPEVRAQIERAGGSAPPVDAAGHTPIAYRPSNEPLKVRLGRRLWQRLGVQTRRGAGATLRQPIGTVLVAFLCALARGGYPVRTVRDRSRGCTIEAVLPPDWRTFEGAVTVDVRVEGDGARAEVFVDVPGQGIDYGRCGRVLANLLRDVDDLLRQP
ncbi:MAG TPA: hypothetical protein VMU51_08255 [Mycobacteriales bacterium]|nr:hypothetical protein [Mycobacteriales bacterium]